MTDASSRHTHQDYSVFGLRVRSIIPLPELFSAVGEPEPDVFIHEGPIEAPPMPAGLRATPQGLLLTVPGVSRYLISGGRSITVEPGEGVEPRNVRLFLLGSAFGALLHQRGILPLHANAIEIDGKAFAFMGASGAGKSTLAAWFHDQGYRVIADDVCVVGFAAGEVHAAPGLPRLRLWGEALEMTGRTAAGYGRSYIHEREQLEKFDIPIASEAAAQRPIRLAAVYLLARGTNFRIDSLQGIAATDAVFANTYRGDYVTAASNHQEHWFASIKLVRSLPVFRATRPWDVSQLDEQCRQLLAHARSQICSEEIRAV